MPDPRRVELDELLIRPGTYFNPQTEVLVVVDDPELDSEIFNMEEFEGADWVLISDETPVDEQRRDELLDAFQVRTTRRPSSTTRKTWTRSSTKKKTRGAGGVAGPPTWPGATTYSAALRTAASLVTSLPADCRHCPYWVTPPFDPPDELEPTR